MDQGKLDTPLSGAAAAAGCAGILDAERIRYDSRADQAGDAGGAGALCAAEEALSRLFRGDGNHSACIPSACCQRLPCWVYKPGGGFKLHSQGRFTAGDGHLFLLLF